MKEKVWVTVLASDSPYFSASTAGKLSSDESCSLAKLVQCLLTMHSDKLDKSTGKCVFAKGTVAMVGADRVRALS